MNTSLTEPGRSRTLVSAWIRLTAVPVLFTVLTLGLSLTLGYLWNEDFWWYLASGERILSEGGVPQHDMFLYSLDGEGGWITHSWLWTVALAVVNRTFGLQAVIVFGGALVAALLVLIFARARLDKFGLINGTLTTLVLIVGNERLLLRADLSGWLLVALYIWILDRKRELAVRHLVTLVLLQLLWANLHGSFYLGILLTLAYTVGGFLNKEPGRPPIWLVPVLAGVSLVTPDLSAEHLGNTFMVLAKQGYLLEWRATLSTVAQREPWIWGLCLLVGLASFIKVRSARKLSRLLLLAGFAVIGAYALRFVLGFAIVAVMITMLNLRDRGLEWSMPRARRWKIAYGAAASLFCLIGVAGAIELWRARSSFELGQSRGVWSSLTPMSTTRRAADFILNQGIRGPILNDMELGGYLIYRLCPEHRLFIDSRQLSLPLVDRYIGIMTSRREWQAAEAEYGFRAVVLSNLASVSPLALHEFLLDDTRWRMVYLDPQAVIFVRDQPTVLPRIEPIGTSRAPFLVPESSWLRRLALQALLRYEPRGLLSHYLAVLGDLRQYGALEELATQTLELHPDDPKVLWLRGTGRLVTGSLPAATRDFEEVIRLRPADPEARVSYAFALYSLGRSRAALEQLNFALEIDPANPRAADLLARISAHAP